MRVLLHSRPERAEYLVHVVRGNQHVTGLSAILGRGADDHQRFEFIHQPGGEREADPEFALEHRRRTVLGGDHLLSRMGEQDGEVLRQVTCCAGWMLKRPAVTLGT